MQSWVFTIMLTLLQSRLPFARSVPQNGAENSVLPFRSTVPPFRSTRKAGEAELILHLRSCTMVERESEA